MSRLSRGGAVERALATVERRLGELDLPAPGVSAGDRDALLDAGRITVAFHPDRLDRRGLTAVEGLRVDGAYLPQWVTGASSGSRSAVTGGLRATWERAQFGVDADIEPAHRPVYGALDLLHHRHGGSPAFGSCYLVLDDRVRARCTLSVGDSHRGPDRIGTFRRSEAVLAGLIEQADAGHLLGQDLGRDDLAAVLAGRHRAAPRRTLDAYVEAQIHGGIPVEDIAAVVVDPSFATTPVAAQLERLAATTGVEVRWHPGTVVTPHDLAADPAAIAWVGDDAYLARLVSDLERLAAPSPVASAADIGRLVADLRPGPPVTAGDPPGSPLQRVKHLWRLTYLSGRDPADGSPRAPRPVAGRGR